MAMIVYPNIDEVSAKRPVVTIGFFDGVHLGHSQIIGITTKKARELGCPSLLITFWPHPRLVLRNDPEHLKLITSLEEKQLLIAQVGIDGMLVLPFTMELASTSALEFIQKILVEKLHVSAIVLGYNHAFGHKGQGNYNLLKQHEADGNYLAYQVNPVSIDGDNVSSTRIREALGGGNISMANAMLGRQFSLAGTIEGGQQIGRIIGFPTANIKPSDNQKLIPSNGVYAIWVDYQGFAYPAMLNVGIRPTIGDGLKRTIEAHIIGFNQNIYSEQITIRFVEKIREEQRFNSLDCLREQLIKDKFVALNILTSH